MAKGSTHSHPAAGQALSEGVGQPALVIWVEYANPPRPATGWWIGRLAC